jgi:lipoprotein-releasing system permease protein
MSRLPFELLLALRYLRPKRTFVSIITLISVLGVTLGVAVLIIVISVMSGFDSQMREKILGFNSHLKVYEINTESSRKGVLHDFAVVANMVKSNQNVTSVSPFVLAPVYIQTEPAKGNPLIASPFVRGVDTSSKEAVSLISTNIKEGTFDLEDHGMLVGTDFANQMELQLGDRVGVLMPRDLMKMKESMDKGEKEVILPKDYVIKGIFDTGYYEWNSTVVVTSLEEAQDMYELPGSDVQGLMVMIKDPAQADKVRDQVQATLGKNYLVTSWIQESSIMAAVLVEKNVMLYILFFIVIVAAFGITCTLITFVVVKTREIGILKALGANSRQIMWIFLSQSMIVNVMGVIAGLIAGLLLLHYRNQFLHTMRNLTGMELFPANIYGFSELPALIVPRDLVIICGGSFIICLIAAAFPAWSASRLKPMEALRHD